VGTSSRTSSSNQTAQKFNYLVIEFDYDKAMKELNKELENGNKNATYVSKTMSNLVVKKNMQIVGSQVAAGGRYKFGDRMVVFGFNEVKVYTNRGRPHANFWIENARMGRPYNKTRKKIISDLKECCESNLLLDNDKYIKKVKNYG